MNHRSLDDSFNPSDDVRHGPLTNRSTSSGSKRVSGSKDGEGASMAKIPERALKAAKRAIVQPLTALKALDRILRRAGELTAFAYLELLRLVLSLLIVLVFPILCFVGSFFLGGLIAAGLTYLDASVDTGLTLFIFVGFPAYAFLFFVIYALPHVRPVVRHLLATTMATTHTATGDDDMTTKKEDHEGKLL